MIKFDASHAFLKEDILSYQDVVNQCHEMLHHKTEETTMSAGLIGQILTIERNLLA